MNKPVVMVLSPGDLALGNRIADAIDGQVCAYAARVPEADIAFEDTRAQVQSCFAEGRPIVAIMAAGALIRLLAQLLTDKSREPPVIAVASDGSAVVPLLGGHHGANDLARKVAAAIDARCAVTTSGDLKLGIALDAPPSGYRLANPANAKSIMARLLAGETATLEGNADWLQQSAIAFSENSAIALTISEARAEAGENELLYHPANMVLGIGCERGTAPDEAISLAERVLEEADVSPLSLACVASLDLKADEAALHEVARYFDVPARFFSAPQLEREASRLANPSEIVFAETGCHGVAEGAALAAVGRDGALVVAKTKSQRATAALARAPGVITDMPGRARGTLFVVGIGPGNSSWRSPEVSRMLERAQHWVGYSLYLDLVGDINAIATRHDFPLGKEEDRVRHAMELAGKGEKVALICSGDAGIYAMATLVFELLEKGGLPDAARRIAIEVSPGISALQAAAARAGAPLGHDFCTISLSDLLTPWPNIQRRVKAAAEGDFVIAFYNPVSKRRRTQLAHARDVLLEHRPADTPVILATNLGREGERVRIVPLSQLQVDDVDMLTVVVVGSSQSRVLRTGDGRDWVYTPRGYAAKEGTGIGVPPRPQPVEGAES